MKKPLKELCLILRKDRLARKKKKQKKKAAHTEATNFSSDRSLANEILFLQDMGWWLVEVHAVPDSEIGHRMEGVQETWGASIRGPSSN